MSINLLFASTDYLLIALIGLVLATISLLVLTKSQRRKLLRDLPLWLPQLTKRSRSLDSDIPPGSLIPEKKLPTNAPPPVSYADIFPPSTRPTLAKAAGNLPGNTEGLLNSNGNEESEIVIKNNIIPFTADYRDCDSGLYTCTGVSVAEVKALDDFSDYAGMSEVPLPEPYGEFVIEKALPRPYRPFRWGYHQTMCMFRLPLSSFRYYPSLVPS